MPSAPNSRAIRTDQRHLVEASLTRTAARDMGGRLRTNNDHARRALINGAAWNVAATEPADIQTDADRLARLVELVGDVAAGYVHGHLDVDSELLRVIACGMSWLDARTAEQELR